MASVDFFSGSAFIGAGLTAGFHYDHLGSGEYWDACFIPNSANESLTIIRKTFFRPADGNITLDIVVANNTANDTFFDAFLVRIY